MATADSENGRTRGKRRATGAPHSSRKLPLAILLLYILLGALTLVGCDSDSNPTTDAGGDTGQDAEPDIVDDAGDDADGGGECGEAPVHCLLEELTADYVDPHYTAGKAIGLVVGVAKPGARYVTGFGATTLHGDTPPDADSIFEIGSVTKIYTAYLLAMGMGRGEVALTDTLEETFGPNVPRGTERSITLLDLVTHTSGLRNFPTNLVYPGSTNPAREYTVALLEEYLATATLLYEPGTTFEYSNLGAGIAGHITTLAAGESTFEALVQRDICLPSGFTDTTTVLNTTQLLRKVQGYRAGMEAPAVDIGEPLHSSGMLRSTGDELLRFFEGALTMSDPAWIEVMTPYRDSPNGVNAKTGLLLNIEDPDGDAYYAKNGGTPGFTTWVVFTLDPPAVVVLLSNMNATEGLYDLAKEILTELETLQGF